MTKVYGKEIQKIGLKRVLKHLESISEKNEILPWLFWGQKNKKMTMFF